MIVIDRYKSDEIILSENLNSLLNLYNLFLSNSSELIFFEEIGAVKRNLSLKRSRFYTIYYTTQYNDNMSCE